MYISNQAFGTLSRSGCSNKKIEELKTTYRDKIMFRANSKFRRLEVIAEAETNYANIVDHFTKTTIDRQLKILDNYYMYGKISLNRILYKKANISKYAKNKLFLYGDIEMVVFYFFSIKNLHKYLKNKELFDYLDFEEHLLGFLGILEELEQVDYQRVLRFAMK